jgi:hypothetical protein
MTKPVNIGQELVRRLKRFTDNIGSIMKKPVPQSDLPLLTFISLTDNEIKAIEWSQKEAEARSKILTSGLGEGIRISSYSDTLRNLLKRSKIRAIISYDEP